MNEQLKLGQLIEGVANRDAIHVAVAPVKANGRLEPGQRVGFMPDSREVVTANAERFIGIVDPFLQESVQPDQRFYLWLFPNTVSGMRHQWTHPDFDGPTLEASIKWVTDFAALIDQTYSSVMEAAGQYVQGGYDRYTYDNTESYKGYYDRWAEFWPHYERITGKKVDDDEKEACPFTCSC